MRKRNKGRDCGRLQSCAQLVFSGETMKTMGIFGTLGIALLSLYQGRNNKSELVEVKDNVRDVHLQLNSRFDEWSTLIKETAHAKGVLEGEAATKPGEIQQVEIVPTEDPLPVEVVKEKAK